MLTHLIIAVIFIITLFVAYVEDYLKETHKVFILVCYALVFIILATTKSIENTADAKMYELMFYENDDPLNVLATEPTFIHLSRLVIACGGTISVMFFIYALISVPAKLKAMYSLTPYVFTALLIYIPVYFELHDMIQIRVSVAAMFLLCSLKPLADKRYLTASSLVICGILFHYSAVAFLPFLFIGNRKLNTFGRIIIAVLLPLCFVMYLRKMDLFSLIPSALTAGKLDYYQAASETGDWENLALLYKNLYFMMKCVLLYVCLYFYDYLTEKNPLAPLLINLFAASLLIMLSMATIPVIASRVSDLYGIVDCLVFTFCLYLVRPPYIVKTGIALVGIYMLAYNFLFTEYFT